MSQFSLLPHVYQIGGSHLTDPKDCSCFLIRDDPCVLIDCGTPDGVPNLVANMAETGTSPADVEMVIGTHGHYDHVAAVPALKEMGDFTFLLHEEDCEAVEKGDGVLTASQLMYHLPFPAFKVDQVLTDGQEFQLKNCRLTVVHTPGHTRGSICVLASWSDFTVLFSGDTVWGGYHPAITAGIETWAASLEKLESMEFDAMVWGHGGCVVYGDAKRRVQEARQALGVYFVPWRTPVTATGLRYGGDPLNPGRLETGGVP